MIEIHSSFLSPIKTVKDNDRVLGYMARLADNSYIVQPFGEPMAHVKSESEALEAIKSIKACREQTND